MEQREDLKQQIERARERVIKLRRIKRMKDFQSFSEHVNDIATKQFGMITEDIRNRLDFELKLIDRYDRTELLNLFCMTISELKEKGIFARASLGYGYNVSLVCYLLGISLFNPMDHPELITDTYVRNTLSQAPVISFRMDKDGTEVIDKFLEELNYHVEKNNMKSCGIRRLTSPDDGSSFAIHYYCRPGAGRLRRLQHELGSSAFADIPKEDSQTLNLINSLDLHGTTTSCFSPITLEAIRMIQPHSISELTETLSFTSEKQLASLMRYIKNREEGVTEYTGHRRIDEQLRHTNGILLFTRQKRECLKWVNRKFFDSEQEFESYKKAMDTLLESSLTENKCDKYVEAFNLYRLAYAKVHYPEIFKKIISI